MLVKWVSKGWGRRWAGAPVGTLDLASGRSVKADGLRLWLRGVRLDCCGCLNRLGRTEEGVVEEGVTIDCSKISGGGIEMVGWWGVCVFV